MTAENIIKAEALTRLGIAVFPVYVKPDPDNPYKTSKKPGIKDGVLGATLDPGYVHDLFERHPNAHVAVNMGMSGLVAADIDVKHSPDGTVEVDGWSNFDRAWLDLPGTFDFDSVTGVGGKQFIYAAPEGVKLGPAGNYRGILGLDRRGGNSYSVWNGPVPESRDVFTPAPEWLCDESAVKSAAQFEGTVKDWYETLETGEPSLIVRSAMDRARKQFEEAGNDWDHAAVVERTYEAVRLGAERHPGVPELLALIEDLFYARTGSHSRPEEEWAHEFQESLASGIAKYGDTIDLYKNLPPFNLATVPAGVPDRLLVGEPGDKDTWRDLMRALMSVTDDDLYVTSALWNSVRTRDLSREWGLEFIHKRVVDARAKPEPVRENPALEEREPVEVKEAGSDPENVQPYVLLTDTERYFVDSTKTFIDEYMAASLQKGFSQPAYDIPAAWTALSMTVGTKAVCAYNALGVNLWFIEMGETGTGKTQSQDYLRAVLDLFLRDGESYYNVGASSSPAAIHEELLMRDDKPSMIHHDEAASFFSDLRDTQWVKTLEHHFSSFYDGNVEPSNKIRLPKELRGKHATTSFNLNMSATPAKLLSLVTTDMFESGFLSRVNWTWAPVRPDTDERFEMKPSKIDPRIRTHASAYDLAANLSHVAKMLPPRSVVDGTPEAWKRLSKAAKQMDALVRKDPQYAILRGPLTRLQETSVKCAALLALYRGDTVFTLQDVLVSLRYVSEWFETTRRVVAEASESEFSRDANLIEAFIRATGPVSEAKILHQFKGMIQRAPRELTDRIDFLVNSGRLIRHADNRRISYEVNE